MDTSPMLVDIHMEDQPVGGVRTPRSTDDRRGRTRRVTDSLKMGCPFCGSSESCVIKSYGGIAADKIRRRRQCGECGRRFPTSERVDRQCLAQELALLEGPVHPVLLEEPLLPSTWPNAKMLLHRLWGQATEGEYVQADWRQLQQVLAGLTRPA